MASAAHNLLDRAGWAPGPWTDEPDRLEFEEHGFPCLIRRIPIGTLCGYVAVPPGHPAHGRDFMGLNVRVHGELSYAGACKGEICHAAKPGEPGDVWWFGFDTHHAFDVLPALAKTMPPVEGAEYRTIRYVTEQCEQLAQQLKEMAA